MIANYSYDIQSINRFLGKESINAAPLPSPSDSALIELP